MIIGYLEKEVTQINNLVTEAEDSIILLHERRSTLISVTVTGKIDVRGMVEPTLKPEPEPA